MKGRKVGHPGQLVEAEGPVEVLLDVVHNPVDAGQVLVAEEFLPVDGNMAELV